MNKDIKDVIALIYEYKKNNKQKLDYLDNIKSRFVNNGGNINQLYNFMESRVLDEEFVIQIKQYERIIPKECTIFELMKIIMQIDASLTEITVAHNNNKFILKIN